MIGSIEKKNQYMSFIVKKKIKMLCQEMGGQK